MKNLFSDSLIAKPKNPLIYKDVTLEFKINFLGLNNSPKLPEPHKNN
jgi:hypothetical protein